MSVNKMYAKYLERFGSASVPSQDAARTTPNSDKRNAEAALHVQSQVSSQQRREEEKIDSRSPDTDDMMESTGMQRSSVNKPSPPVSATLQE